MRGQATVITSSLQVSHGLCKLGSNLWVVVWVGDNARDDPNPLALQREACLSLAVQAFLANTCGTDIPEWHTTCAALCTGSVQALQLSDQVTSGHVCSMKAAVCTTCKCQLHEEYISASAVEAML